MPSDSSQTARDLVNLLNTRGLGDYIGEPISQLEHCLQAAHLAREARADDETVAAALLHDVGQFLPLSQASAVKNAMLDSSGHIIGRVGHERIGEEYLRSLGFNEKVCRLVGSHVAAKRYLTAVDSAYYESLSSASKRSLKVQGGPFQGEELQNFSNDPWKDEMVSLRKWDDAAKEEGIEDRVPRAHSYELLLTAVLEKRPLNGASRMEG